MKILFIYKYQYGEPLGIMYLSSFLKKHGHNCYFIDLKFEKNYIREIQKISPDIICYSITTGKQKYYQKINYELKKKLNFFSLWGGPHCTFFPEIIYEKDIDVVCIGEGEFALLELADKLRDKKDITKIKNLWVKINNKVYKNEIRNLIEDLDILPFPDRELVSKYKKYRIMSRRWVMSGRGCPYNCNYCFNHSYNKLYKNKGKIIRKRSVENFIEELRFIKKEYPPKMFQFADDLFILDKEWVLKFCKAYKEIKIPFMTNVRVNLVDEKIVKALKSAGCHVATYAIESGNEHIRNKIIKRGISEKQTIEAAKLFNKYKIKTCVQNMIGLPDETLENAFETVSLNIKCKPTFAWISVFNPYPKTELWDYSKKKGYFNGDINQVKERYFGSSILKMKDIEKMERLHYLFSWGIMFPILIPLIKILIRLPLNKFYLFLWHLFRIWYYLFKIKALSIRELF